MAMAQPIAAPVMPYLGISARSTPMLIPTVSNPLARLQLLRPAVISTMLTWPHTVASSMERPRMTMTM